ncbi:MAG: metal-dependent phosphohydrolase [Comamonadaceae bacterium CG1_02_60_18]|nr:MAG: metal-dependent phosphohydrolase [Comamonadaceae bacterium CG1_02_60_18]PIQ53142.1 MAG: metal-dependent phosphohydrolase [Comamonadaceae bacterium CG12_big_fil_rev_8_21_14_0_65_59_15]
MQEATSKPCASDAPNNFFVTPDRLCLGLFVSLDVPWFAHDFTLNSFKIRNDDQLHGLRALKLARYRIDPQRSDAQALAACLPTGLSRAVEPRPAEAPASAPAQQSPAQLAKRERVRALAQRREQLANVERAFSKAGAVMKSLNRNLLSMPKETLEEMGALVGQMTDAFLENPDATLHVMGERAGGEDVYYHSLNVTILAMMLAQEMGLDVAAARDLGIGAMLHDVGLMDIPDRVLRKSPEDYNQAERNLRQQHVDYGVTMAQKLGIACGALAVVAQHHELADGSGYPKGLKADAMTPAARLVSLVNFYDNLCNPVDLKKAMTPHQALSFMFAQRRSKFDVKALQLLVRSLGVYPPGSIVHLSNDALALVTSVNPRKPLRPWVMVYDPNVPLAEAIMLDLEQEPDINITKAISPVMLPAPAAAYLNPRKHVTYFFDGTQTEPGSKPGGWA